MSASPRRSTLLALVAAAALAGCGGSDDDASEVLDDRSRSAGGDTSRPIAPPPATESLAEAQKRIEAAGSDCEKLFELLPLNTSEEARTPQRCDAIARVTEGTQGDGEEYGELAAVIDYELTPEDLASLILIRESDGLYHVALADPAVTEPSTQTQLERDEADAAMDATMEALAEGDCDALLAVRFQGFGAKSELEREPICEALDRDAVAAALEEDPDLRPELIGGNGDYVFYGLSTARGHHTFVLIRQKPHAELAEDAPAYGFHHRYVTASAKDP